MLSLAEFDPWWRFGIALLIGALIGLEREFYQQRKNAPDFAGIRTFSLIALLGSVSAFLADDFGIALAVLALGGLVLMIAISYAGAIRRANSEMGITTEIAAVLTFLFGALVMGDHAMVAAALAVVTSLLLLLKGRLHELVRDMDVDDIHATLQFALVAAVILPLLPNRTIDPLDLLNPFQIWLMVVLVSGIGFSGYVLMKILGPSRGINLMGFLGGLASSTATTLSFSSASREYPEMAGHYAGAVVLSSTVMLLRVFVFVLALYPPLALEILAPLAAMLAAGLLVILVSRRRQSGEKPTMYPDFKISNPLKISTAIKFGLFFSIVLIVVKYARSLLGTTGVYLASLLTGLTDVDAIVLGVTRLAGETQLAVDVASAAIIIAVLTNTVSKGAIVYFSGSPELRRRVVRAFSFMVAAGGLAAVLAFALH